MRSLLEKAIVHLLNGDEDKAEVLFHKFMVERARGIHESLRQNEDAQLNEGWENEIEEEEYFDADDEGEEGGEGMAGDAMAGDEAPVEDEGIEGDVPMGDEAMDDVGDDIEGADDSDLGGEEEMMPGAEGEGLEAKLDNIEAQMDELSAQFDELMAKYDGDDVGGEDDGIEDMGDGDEVEGSMDDLGDADGDMGEEEFGDGEDKADLADRMEDDMHDPEAMEDEDELAMSEGKDDASEDMQDMDEDADMLSDITESVLDELEKVSAPGNTEGKTGDGKVPVSKDPFLPSYPVNDRVKQAKPFMIKATGDAHNDKMEREAPPKVQPGSKRRNNDAGVKSLKTVANPKNVSKATQAPYVGDPNAPDKPPMAKKTSLPIDGSRKVAMK